MTDSTNARPLPKRPLGRTGIDVTALGFGSAPLGDIYTLLDDAEAIATAEAAADAGVTLFDTAPFYGQGSAEHRIGTALRRHPDQDFVVSTKAARAPRALSAGCRSTSSTTTATTPH
jgi:D-threo-aldose 1-dehydrogenase